MSHETDSDIIQANKIISLNWLAGPLVESKTNNILCVCQCVYLSVHLLGFIRNHIN